MLRRIGSWTLIVVGVLALALFVATFVTTDDKSAWPGFVFFFVIALAVIALGVRGLRGSRRMGPKVPFASSQPNGTHARDFGP